MKKIVNQGMPMFRAVVFTALLLACLPAAATEAGWAMLRNGGQVVLISHADAPTGGNPTSFDIENCTTQQNLSDRGRQQARRMGALFFARAAPIQEVLTSRYCRAVDTAEVAFSDAGVEPFAPLDALAMEPESEAAQIKDMLERILEYSGAGNLLMVTHPQNIEALTGIRPRVAEAIILSRSEDEIGVAGRINFN